MKRFLFFFLAMMLAMGGTAFAGDIPQETLRKYPSWRVNPVGASKIFFDGEEKTLAHSLYRKAEDTMIAAEDLAALISGSVSYDESREEICLRADALNQTDESLHIAYPQLNKEIKMDTTFYGDDTAEAKKSLDGIWYIPLRKTAEDVCYTVTWKREGSTEYFMLQSPPMPKITATAGYDPTLNWAVMTMVNREKKDFIYSDEFTLQVWDGTEWQRAPQNREICYIIFRGIVLPALEKDTPDAFSKIERYGLRGYGDGIRLSPGKYRICQDIWEKEKENPIRYVLCAEFDVE